MSAGMALSAPSVFAALVFRPDFGSGVFVSAAQTVRPAVPAHASAKNNVKSNVGGEFLDFMARRKKRWGPANDRDRKVLNRFVLQQSANRRDLYRS